MSAKNSIKRIDQEKRPNKTTLTAMKAARKGKLTKAKDFNDICKQLGIWL